MLKKKLIAFGVALLLTLNTSVTAKAWTANSNPTTGNSLPSKTYDVSAAGAGRIQISTSVSYNDDSTKATISLYLTKTNNYEVRYAEIPTLTYSMSSSSDTANGNASVNMNSGTNMDFTGSGTLTGTSSGSITGNIGGNYTDGTEKLSSVSVKGFLQAWHYSGGYWKFTYDTNGGTESFNLTDAQIPNYFTGTYKDFSNTVVLYQTLPDDVISYINANGISNVKINPVAQEGSYVPGTLKASISGNTLTVSYRPRLQYVTNNWWSSSPVAGNFSTWINMPKVRPEYGYNALSVLDGFHSVKLTDKLMSLLYKDSNNQGRFNSTDYVRVDGWSDSYVDSLNNITVGSNLWYGGSMGLAFYTPVDIHFTPLKTSTGSGTLTGSASGTISGTASSQNPDSDNPNAPNSTGISTDFTGTMNVAPNINMDLNKGFNASVDATGSFTGTTDRDYTFDGWTTTDITRYTLNAYPGTTYKKPYIIPVTTTIILPDGTQVSGDYAEYNIARNGPFTFTVVDGRGTRTTVTTNINKIKTYESSLDFNQILITKSKTNGNYSYKSEEVPLENNNSITAYLIEDENDTSKDVPYIFFIRMKDGFWDLSEVIATDTISGETISSVSESEIITKELAMSIYNPEISIDSMVENLPTEIKNFSYGIYASAREMDGYRTILFKLPKRKISDSNRLINIVAKGVTGNTVEKTLNVNIMGRIYNYIVADNNYAIRENRKTTAVFTREKEVNLRNIVDVYNTNVLKVESKVIDKSDSETTLIPSEVFTTSELKSQVEQPFTIPIKRLGISNYTIGTVVKNLDSADGVTTLLDSTRTVDIIYEPIDTLLNTATLDVKPVGNGLNIRFNPSLINSSAILQVLSQNNIPDSAFKIAFVNYSSTRESSVLNASDYPTDDALLNATPHKLGSTINLTTNSSEDIRLVFGVPGVFVDTAKLTNGLNVALPNINDNVPTIIDVSNEKPFIPEIKITNGEYEYLLPRDMSKLKTEGKIRSIKVNGKELINLDQTSLTATIRIVQECLQPFEVSVTNIYGETETVSKIINILDANVIANGARLNNDSTIVITKNGLYDLKTNSFIPYSISNESNPDNGYSIKGIRLVDNKVVLINTTGTEGEIFNSNLESIGIFNTGNTSYDLIEYRDKVYLAEGANGLYSVPISKLNSSSPPITKVAEVPGAIYSLETYASMLLVGSEGDKALRTYLLESNKLSIIDTMTSNDIYDQSGLKVHDITIRNGRLELYPDKSNYHIIIDLP